MPGISAVLKKNYGQKCKDTIESLYCSERALRENQTLGVLFNFPT